MSRKSHHATNLVNLQRSIARHLQRNEPVPPSKAQALAALLWKEQRSRLGQLQNAATRGATMKPRRQPAPDGFIPYASFHAATHKLKARIAKLETENAELRARATIPVVQAAASVIVLAPSNRHAETERNGLTQSSAGETGGIGQEPPVR